MDEKRFNAQPPLGAPISGAVAGSWPSLPPPGFVGPLPPHCHWIYPPDFFFYVGWSPRQSRLRLLILARERLRRFLFWWGGPIGEQAAPSERCSRGPCVSPIGSITPPYFTALANRCGLRTETGRNPANPLGRLFCLALGFRTWLAHLFLLKIVDRHHCGLVFPRKRKTKGWISLLSTEKRLTPGSLRNCSRRRGLVGPDFSHANAVKSWLDSKIHD